MDRRTDGQTDGWTDTPSHRDAWSHLKSLCGFWKDKMSMICWLISFDGTDGMAHYKINWLDHTIVANDSVPNIHQIRCHTVSVVVVMNEEPLQMVECLEVVLP